MARSAVEKKIYSPSEVVVTCGTGEIGGDCRQNLEVKDILSTNQQENDNMTIQTQRRTATVELFDDSPGLAAADALVATCKVVTEDSDEATIRQVLLEKNFQWALEKHNIKRAGLLDEDILRRTGNEVNLRPVKLKDLRWSIK